MLLAHFWSYLTKNSTYYIVKDVSLNPDWYSRLKCQRIGASVNTCLNYVKDYPVSIVKKLGFSTLYTAFIKSNLAYFPSFLPLLLLILLLSILVDGRALAS